MAFKVLKNVRSRRRISTRDTLAADEKSLCTKCLNLTLELTSVINGKDLHTQITKPIGEGSYSLVYEGTWESHCGMKRVAVKILNKAEVDAHQYLQLLLKEASILSNLKHPNIIKLLGIVLDPIKLVMEFAILGDLLSYLSIPGNVFTAKRLQNYAEQIAAAMEFLGKRGIIHRSLAAKSILIQNHDLVRLSKFRSAEYTNEKGIFQSNSAISPERIAWSSLEVLQQGIYSTASDVWSYAITLWEIYSLGAVPWNGSSSTEITDAYLDNKPLDRPRRCHELIYKIMLRCWNAYPEYRISFNDICSALNEVPYEEVVAVTDCRPAEDDGGNLGYKVGDKIVVIDKHTDEWWTGIHAHNGKCGWFQVNNTQSDVTPLDTLKRDIKHKKKHLPNITIGLPTNILHNVHIGKGGEQWYDKPLSSNDFQKNVYLQLIPVKRASSMPASINTSSEGYDDSGQTHDATSAQSSPEVTKKQIATSQQSPLAKNALTPTYANADAFIKAQALQLDSDSYTASCPDIPSHTYYNILSTPNNNALKSPLIASSYDSPAQSDLKTSKIQPQAMQLEPTSNDTNTSSHNSDDLVGEETIPKLLAKEVAIPTTPDQPVLKMEASGDQTHLVSAIKDQLPHIPTRTIVQFLTRNDGNTQQAIEDIKVNQLTSMNLNGTTEADCRIILEKCDWDLNRAAEILCS